MSTVIQNVSTQDPVIVTVGVTQPSLFDTITYNGQTVQFSSGSTVVFFMRPLLSRTPVINSKPAAPIFPPNGDGHNVRYDWKTSDVAIEGEYMGWWGYLFPGVQLAETPEFRIIITDHGPGFGALTGVVVDAIGAIMPVTLNALRGSPAFGDRYLQQHADYIKRLVLTVAVPPDQEISYDPALISYLAKRTAYRLITPAKDFWMRQAQSVSSQGPAENISYPSVLTALDSLKYQLECELPQDWRELQLLVPGLPTRVVEPAPITSFGDPSVFNGPVTPDPNGNQRQRVGGPYFGGWWF